jgi:hypothetical protein
MSMENPGGMISTREGSWFFHQSSLAVPSVQTCSIKSDGTCWKEMIKLVFEVFLFILRTEFLHAVNSCDMGPTDLLPIRRKAKCEFLSPLKTIASAVFVPVNLASNGKHANHYTTKTTKKSKTICTSLFNAFCNSHCRHGLFPWTAVNELMFVTVQCGVLFEVWTGILNNIQTSFDFKGFKQRLFPWTGLSSWSL